MWRGVVFVLASIIALDAAALDPAALEAADVPEDTIEALVERAALERLRGDFGAALADLNEAYELDPEHPDIALQRGLVLAELGYDHAAASDLELVERAFAATSGRERATSLLRKLVAAAPATDDTEDGEANDRWDHVEDPAEARQQLDETRAALRR